MFNRRTDDDNVAERQEDARKFWEYHRLAEVVPEDDFVRGATIFIDLETSRRWAYEHAPANSGVWRPTPDSAPQAHRNVGSEIQEDANALTDQERVLNQLSDLQQTSLRYYLCRTHHLDAHRGDPNLFRKVLFSLGDALFEPFYKDQSFPRKTIWDHIKTLSTAQWQILCTCCLAAMTQYVYAFAKKYNAKESGF